MNLERNNWKFDESVTSVFDDHISKSVPMYKEFNNMILDISAWFLEDGTNVYDLGTSTGELLKNLSNMYKREVKYIGLDNSKSMIEKAKGKNINAEFLLHDISKGFCFNNVSLFFSVLTLQFISESKRQKIVDCVYEGLNKGGAFILVEKTKSDSTRIEEIMKALHYDLKFNNGINEEEIFKKERSLRGVMKTSTVKENMEMLKKSGFKEIDIFLKNNNFVGILAIK